MNARFGAVALSSCLFVLLASQLLPLPSLTRLVEANTHGTTPTAEPGASAVNAVAELSQAPQATIAPQAAIAPQAVSALPVSPPQVAHTLPSIDTSDARQASEAPKAAEAPKAPEAQPILEAPQAVEARKAIPEPQAEPLARAPEVAETAQAADTPRAPPAVAANEGVTNHAAMNHADIATAEPAPLAAIAPANMAEQASEPTPAPSAEQPKAAERPEATERPEAKVELASADPSDMLPAARPTPESPADLPLASPLAAVDPLEAVDECVVVDICVDRYLWALYQRAPKQDKMKVDERRSVTIKRKGKMVTVMRTFTKLVDEDFAWKDPKAADKVGLPVADYVIGGMDRGFKLKLFHILHAAEGAGLSPGITSAFRDDYRQSIASGLKAANDRSYHGGSSRGGYGHGLAADIVSVKGATRMERWAATETLWKWVDEHGKDFGIARPYLSYDPPHVAPTDGQEYASHHHEPSARVASGKKKQTRVAARPSRGAAKRVASGQSKASTAHAARPASYRTAQAKLRG